MLPTQAGTVLLCARLTQGSLDGDFIPVIPAST